MEALRAFSAAGAFASFGEAHTGEVRVGSLADLTIFSQWDEKHLADASVAYTIVGGQVVYDVGKSSPGMTP